MYQTACESCPAPALVLVEFETGGFLYFCGHHERTYFPHGEHDGVTFTYATVSIA